MQLPPSLSAQKRELLEQALAEVRDVPGVTAIALGGSYARGTQHADSDLDVALYYSEAAPFSIDAIRGVAGRLAHGPAPVVTGFYEWGPWVNGGAWIETDAGKLDLLYRSVEHVERTIAGAALGKVEHHYGQQPTHGFWSASYLGETQCCIPLFDPHGVLARLKHSVACYPPKLRQTLVGDSLWAAEFTLWFARKFAAAGDVYNTAGCLTRIAAALTQALFALNETYFVNDKGALEAIAGFRVRPERHVETIEQVLARPGAGPAELARSVAAIETAWQEVVALAGDYRPRALPGPRATQTPADARPAPGDPSAAVREYDATRDAAALRECLVALQEHERGVEPSLPAGEAMADAYLASLLERVARWRGRVFVAEPEDAGRVVGFSCALAQVPQDELDEDPAPYALVSDLVVLPSHRGRGLGRALLAAAEDFARSQGARSLTIGVLSRNSLARELYLDAGFSDYRVELRKRL